MTEQRTAEKPMVQSPSEQAAATMVVVAEPEVKDLQQVLRREDPLSPQSYDQLCAFCDKLVYTGFLPKALDTGEKVLAVVMTGRELGIPMMASTRLIHIVDGRPGLAAELMLAMFGRAGGRWQWLRSDDEAATLRLVKPSGDEHIETFALEDAQVAGLLDMRDDQKPYRVNWYRHRTKMLRARCISGGMRAFAPDVTNGLYTPDELEDIRAQEQSATPAMKAEEPATEAQRKLVYRFMRSHVWSEDERKANKEFAQDPKRTRAELTERLQLLSAELEVRQQKEGRMVATDVPQEEQSAERDARTPPPTVGEQTSLVVA